MATPLTDVGALPAQRTSPQKQQQMGSNRNEVAVVHDANALLEKIGFAAHKFEKFEDLVASVSSMSVALYEKLFQFRLERIVRVPKRLEDYERNAQIVVDALSAALLENAFDTVDVTGELLCVGDVDSIRHVLRMFEQIYGILEEANRRGEPAQLATPPSHASSSAIASITSMQRKKKLTKTKKKTRKSAAIASEAHKSVLGSSEEEEEQREEKERNRSTTTMRRQHSKKSSRHTSHSMRGDVNMYETSKTSITRSRHGLSADRRKSTDSKHQGSATTNQSKAMCAKQKQQQDEKLAVDLNLLKTQKYGRFVPVARARRNSNSGSDSVGDDRQEERVSDTGEEAQLGSDDEQMYFGGVSSVSNASGSEKSVHFIEDDDDNDVSRDFASITDDDVQNTAPNVAAAATMSPRNAYDDDNEEVARVRSPRDNNRKDKQKVSTSMHKQHTSTNQQDADDSTAGPASPVKKANVGKRKQPKAPAPVEPTMSPPEKTSKRDSASSLYPLQPASTRHAATSKSHTEYMRYKLYLKDHLQDLRQIRARRFQQDIRLHRIAVGLDSKHEEEKQLRHTLSHILQLEKEKLRDEHRTTSTILKQIQKDHAEREKSLEAFYSNQIELVKEQTHREVQERELVEKAHRLASEQLLREMRKERESQIAALLQEKQHLEEARRFRAASKLAQALERSDEAHARTSQARVDAFYTAAMKARQQRTATSATTKKKSKTMAQAAAVYSSRAHRTGAPLTRRVK
ncbi:hypothetical protein FI667_g8930, partial [Globisporangium splendens]